MNSNTRLLNPADLPRQLWNADNQIIYLPHKLHEVYIETLEENDLIQLKTSSTLQNKSIIGGQDKEKTEQHFAKRFDGSCARMMLTTLDPKGNLGEISDHLIELASKEEICIVDAPSGTGAASLTLLCTVAELRERAVLPRIPMSVKIIGGEYSESANYYFRIMLDKCNSYFESQAIHVTLKIIPWNVTDKIANTEFVKRCILESQNYTNKLLLVANFNGFLVKDKKQKEAKLQLDELFRYMSGKNHFALWIEPNMNRADNLFEWLRSFSKTFIRFFSSDKYVFESNLKCASTVLEEQANGTFNVTLKVMPIYLEGSL